MARVIHLTTVHSPFDTRIFQKECKTLVKNGYDVTLIARHSKNETVDGIKIIALPEAKNRMQRMLGLTLKAFQLALKQKADIYHFHDPELIPFSILLKLIAGKPVISDIHEDYYNSIMLRQWINKHLRKIAAILYIQLQKILLRQFDAVIVVNESIGSKIKHMNTVIVRNFNTVDEDLRKIDSVRKSPAPSLKRIIFVGGIARVRGIKEIVQAMEYFKDDEIEFVMAGMFCDHGFEDELRSYDGYRKVKWLGYLDRENLLRELALSDMAAALASVELDGLPNKLTEYMTAGLPIITCTNASWSKIVKEHECGIVVKSMRPEDIASGIRYLLDNPEAIKKMGEAGRKAAMEKYNWKTEEQKLIGLYQKILG